MHQEEEIINLAREFSRCRENKKQFKYPQDLWEKAFKLCERFSYPKVADLIGVHKDSLRRQLKSFKKTDNSFDFIPIQITEPQSSIQIHLKTPIPIKIEFSRSTEELAKLLLTIQGNISC